MRLLVLLDRMLWRLATLTGRMTAEHYRRQYNASYPWKRFKGSPGMY